MTRPIKVISIRVRLVLAALTFPVVELSLTGPRKKSFSISESQRALSSFPEGRKEGRKEGKKEGRKSGRKDGPTGRTEERMEGMQDGREIKEGKKDGR